MDASVGRRRLGDATMRDERVRVHELARLAFRHACHRRTKTDESACALADKFSRLDDFVPFGSSTCSGIGLERLTSVRGRLARVDVRARSTARLLRPPAQRAPAAHTVCCCTAQSAHAPRHGAASRCPCRRLARRRAQATACVAPVTLHPDVSAADRLESMRERIAKKLKWAAARSPALTLQPERRGHQRPVRVVRRALPARRRRGL